MDVSITLSHVSPRWRHIAINCKDLWTHIDLVLDRFPAKNRPSKMETFLTRAGAKSLNIHIISSGLPVTRGSGPYTNLLRLLATVAPRTHGVIWDSPERSRANAFLCTQAISAFLKGCSPGTLTEFSVGLFLDRGPFVDEETLTNQSEATVEALWLPVKVLQLRNFYPKWTSNLYQGLTELRLSVSRWEIPQSALVAILKSSPKLRVLEIGMAITKPGHTSWPATPVPLVDLEVLLPKSFRPRDLLTLMSLIQPGQKPLTLLIIYSPKYKTGTDFSEHQILKDFFARSKVARMILSELENYCDLLDLLTIAPTVRVLALENLTGLSLVNSDNLPSPAPALILDALYVTRSSNYTPTHRRGSKFASRWPLIKKVVRRHGVSKLILWSYSFGKGVVPDNLHTVCPQVTIISDVDPDPTQEWTR